MKKLLFTLTLAWVAFYIYKKCKTQHHVVSIPTPFIPTPRVVPFKTTFTSTLQKRKSGERIKVGKIPWQIDRGIINQYLNAHPDMISRGYQLRGHGRYAKVLNNMEVWEIMKLYPPRIGDRLDNIIRSVHLFSEMYDCQFTTSVPQTKEYVGVTRIK